MHFEYGAAVRAQLPANKYFPGNKSSPPQTGGWSLVLKNKQFFISEKLGHREKHPIWRRRKKYGIFLIGTRHVEAHCSLKVASVASPALPVFVLEKKKERERN
jgi:hypothetical protein